MKCIVCKRVMGTSSKKTSFKFPKDTVLRRKWLDALRISHAAKIHKGVRVCEDHFDSASLRTRLRQTCDLYSTPKKILNEDAVPLVQARPTTTTPADEEFQDDEDAMSEEDVESESSSGSASGCVVEIHWEEHKDVLRSQLWTAFEEEHMVDTDVGCRVTGTSERCDSVRVHGVVLAAFMPAAFGKGAPTYDLICGIHATNFRALMEFAYTGRVAVPVDRLDSLQQLAENLNFEGLVEAIMRLRRARLTNADAAAAAPPPLPIIELNESQINLVSIKEEPVDDVDEDLWSRPDEDNAISVKEELLHSDHYDDYFQGDDPTTAPIVNMVIKEEPIDPDDLYNHGGRRTPENVTDRSSAAEDEQLDRTIGLNDSECNEFENRVKCEVQHDLKTIVVVHKTSGQPVAGN